MNRKKIIAVVFLLIGMVGMMFAAEEAAAATAGTVDSTVSAFKYLAAALAVGIACIAGGMAVGRIGAAAMGAMSENSELSGKALPFVGLAEGICLWGFLVALLIILL
ncbi:ATP synthase subunit C [Brucepastera parasyntrophica]|uniref:ATP synthase subunit C n=1 Tax=Brucepastera parasyntrophica TaxID=2880008 RepID=UPI00210AE066|nr:ATP synthase subunit C [Brucepastera parasyntrophica]ULQ60355.1 ATP synthase subunit C [Brucepastera parasyntrophica]